MGEFPWRFCRPCVSKEWQLIEEVVRAKLSFCKDGNEETDRGEWRNGSGGAKPEDKGYGLWSSSVKIMPGTKLSKLSRAYSQAMAASWPIHGRLDGDGDAAAEVVGLAGRVEGGRMLP